eukprot:g14441.t1
MPNKAQHQKAITAARELCDTLLGINRSRLPGKGGGVVIKFHDRDVCKYTLCGVCPHRLFSNTKSDMGSCSYAICGAENPKMSDPLKEWNKLPQNEKDKYGYEYNTMLYLQKLVRGCDNKIVQSKRRLEAEDRPATMAELNEDDKQKLVEIAQQMQDKTLEAQKFGDEENISEALRIMQEIDVLNKRRKAITEGGGAVAAGIKQNESKLIVCEVTGHYYSSMDGEERMALYFQGKQYRGWKRLREYLQKLEQQRPPRGLREYEERSDRNGRGGSNGDEWYCEQCNTSNFADRYKCRKCRAPKPGGRGRDFGGGSRPYKRQRREEWTCTQCGRSNFMDRQSCRNCRAPKPGGNSGFSNSGGGGGDQYSNNRRDGNRYGGDRGGGRNYRNNWRGDRGGGYGERNAPRQRRW